jgi:hypothetical protein
MKYETQMASAYYKLLTRIDWQDQAFVAGIREGLNKFLTCVYLRHSFQGKKKHHTTHYVSADALECLQVGEYSDLVFEHTVPKQQYIQEPCEERARSGDLTVEYIERLLMRYWRLASVTKAEDFRLPPRMPDGWDGNDCFARYEIAGIVLMPNPFFCIAANTPS